MLGKLRYEEAELSGMCSLVCSLPVSLIWQLRCAWHSARGREYDSFLAQRTQRTGGRIVKKEHGRGDQQNLGLGFSVKYVWCSLMMVSHFNIYESRENNGTFFHVCFNDFQHKCYITRGAELIQSPKAATSYWPRSVFSSPFTFYTFTVEAYYNRVIILFYKFLKNLHSDFVTCFFHSMLCF